MKDKEHETKVYKWNPNKPYVRGSTPDFTKKTGWTIRPTGKYWRTKK
jgi:hypothetical protein